MGYLEMQEMNEVKEIKKFTNAPSKVSELEAYKKGYDLGLRQGYADAINHILNTGYELMKQKLGV